MVDLLAASIAQGLPDAGLHNWPVASCTQDSLQSVAMTTKFDCVHGVLYLICFVAIAAVQPIALSANICWNKRAWLLRHAYKPKLRSL